MRTDASLMRCGACGGDTVQIYLCEDNLIAECCGCKSTSVITVSKPKIEIEWSDDEDSDGILTVF